MEDQTCSVILGKRKEKNKHLSSQLLTSSPHVNGSVCLHCLLTVLPDKKESYDATKLICTGCPKEKEDLSFKPHLVICMGNSILLIR